MLPDACGLSAGDASPRRALDDQAERNARFTSAIRLSSRYPLGAHEPGLRQDLQLHVKMRLAPTLSEALRARRPVDAPAGGIAADSLAPRRVGALMFPIAQAYVARVALVSDQAIRRAQSALWSTVRIAAEPGGAAAFAAILSGVYAPGAGERVGVLVSGGNSTAVDFGEL